MAGKPGLLGVLSVCFYLLLLYPCIWHCVGRACTTGARPLGGAALRDGGGDKVTGDNKMTGDASLLSSPGTAIADSASLIHNRKGWTSPAGAVTTRRSAPSNAGERPTIGVRGRLRSRI